MATYLHEQGYSVYVPRLSGMGTSPRHLAEVSWEDWMHSVDRGYAALRAYCDDISLVGFSAGGLLALMAAARKKGPISSVVAINTPTGLLDKRMPFVQMQAAWNGIADHLHVSGGKQEYVDHKPEETGLNYTRTYIKGIRELEGLDLETAYRKQEEFGRPLRRTEDAQEAQRAFVEKRPPQFKGC